MKNPFEKKKRGKRGEGRATIFKAINLPSDLVDDLYLYKSTYSLYYATEKDEYGTPIPAKVSYEQMLRRWIDNVPAFDPHIANEVNAIKNSRNVPPTYPVDPTEGEVWELGYFFDCDDEDSYPAQIGEIEPFEAIVNGEVVGMEEMLNREFRLYNDAGIEISYRQALIIKNKILAHMDSEN